MELTELDNKQYEIAVAEYATVLSEIRALERYVLVAISGVTVWVLSQPVSSMSAIALWLPTLISIIGGYKMYAYGLKLQRAANYCRQFEENHEEISDIGWFSYCFETRGKYENIFATVYWWVVIIATLLIPAFAIVR